MARRTKRLAKLKLSQLYSFGLCHRSPYDDDQWRIGRVFRQVYVNDPDKYELEGLTYPLNGVSTTKYTVVTFVPKSLFEQFRRVANFYFLVCGILALTPLAPYTAVSAWSLVPLCITVVLTMAKEGYEDWRRKQQDDELNNRIVKVHSGNDGICYVETMNLDGETNLKVKQALEVTLDLNEDTKFSNGVSEVEKAMAMRKGARLDADIENGDHKEKKIDEGPHVKGFNFEDPRIMNGNWIHEPNRDIIRDFFRLLTICHTCVPQVDEIGKVSYESESPDEAAFVIAARELGFEFYSRSQKHITVHERDLIRNVFQERKYEVLNILEFTSSRKRMSVIVKEPEGRILLLIKGADSEIFKRLGPGGRKFEEETRQHINEYSDSGLRTLVLAYRVLDEKDYKGFAEKFHAAKVCVSADRCVKIEEAADSIEKDLHLLGATAVEDKLQKGVPECIDKLAKAGIKIWVLTGDKMETSINIGCRTT
ncbi:hypothetical protein QOZ80_3BG0268210 [Eleusine coracana subsp. coracana]|nr:hypothetical protein QOZ80_3BG0268210 [Eleusine coracana subsp. coracana]